MGRLATEAGGAGVVVGDIGDGRFGLLGDGTIDLQGLGSAVEALVGSFAPDQSVRVDTAQVDLDTGSLGLVQSMQALRLVLSRFAVGGSGGLAGLAGGLPGILRQAAEHKRVLGAIIAAGRFTLAYQPVVALSDRALHHYEALLRLPAGSPGPAHTTLEFVTLAEALGLAQALDLQVARRARPRWRQPVPQLP